MLLSMLLSISLCTHHFQSGRPDLGRWDYGLGDAHTMRGASGGYSLLNETHEECEDGEERGV